MVTKAYFTGLPGGGRKDHRSAKMRIGGRYTITSNDGEWVTVAETDGKFPISCFPFLDPSYQFSCDSAVPDVKQASYLADRWSCTRESVRNVWPDKFPKRLEVMMRGAHLPIKTDPVGDILHGQLLEDVIAATGWSEYCLFGTLDQPRYAARLWDIIRGIQG